MPSLSNSYSTVHWQSLDIQFYNFSKHVLKLLPPASMIFFSIKSASVCLCCVNAILSVKVSGLKTGHCKKKMKKISLVNGDVYNKNPSTMLSKSKGHVGDSRK